MMIVNVIFGPKVSTTTYDGVRYYEYDAKIIIIT
jgi:hypothetical protein